MAKYHVEITSETVDSISFRVLRDGDEVYAGGVDRAEYDAERAEHKRNRQQTLFALAKKRAPEVFGAARLDDVRAPASLAVDTTDVTVPAHEHDDLPHTHVEYVDHDELDAVRRDLAPQPVDTAALDELQRVLAAHTHPHEHPEPAAHGHQALELRTRNVETSVEALAKHQHPHTHAEHDHESIATLNRALIALAEEVRDLRLEYLAHGHAHAHQDTEERLAAVVTRVETHSHTHVHDQYLASLPVHDHPGVDHFHPDIDARLERHISNVGGAKVDLQVLSRENRGGRDIIIAQEVHQ